MGISKYMFLTEFDVKKYKDDGYVIVFKKPLDKIITKHIFKLIFEHVRVNYVGFLVHTNTVVWLSDNVYLTDINQNYEKWFTANFIISGFVFRTERESTIFQQEIQKIFMWETLKI